MWPRWNEIAPLKNFVSEEVVFVSKPQRGYCDSRCCDGPKLDCCHSIVSIYSVQYYHAKREADQNVVNSS